MKKLVLMLGVLVMFVACSDSNEPKPPPPPGSDENYFGTSNGSFWIYSNDSIAVDGSHHPFGKYDTLRQLRDTTYLGRPAKLMDHYFINPFSGTSGRTSYPMIENGSKVYVGQSFLGLFLPNFLVEIFNVLDTIKIADGNAADWNLTEVKAPDTLSIFADIASAISSMLPTAEVSSITGAFKIGFARGSDAVKGDYNTHSFKMRVVFDGTLVLHIPIFGTVPVPFETVFSEIDFYFSNGKGLIEIDAKPMQVTAVAKIPLPGVNDLSIPLMDNMPGITKRLTSTNVD